MTRRARISGGLAALLFLLPSGLQAQATVSDGGPRLGDAQERGLLPPGLSDEAVRTAVRRSAEGGASGSGEDVPAAPVAASAAAPAAVPAPATAPIGLPAPEAQVAPSSALPGTPAAPVGLPDGSAARPGVFQGLGLPMAPAGRSEPRCPSLMADLLRRISVLDPSERPFGALAGVRAPALSGQLPPGTASDPAAPARDAVAEIDLSSALQDSAARMESIVSDARRVKETAAELRSFGGLSFLLAIDRAMDVRIAGAAEERALEERLVGFAIEERRYRERMGRLPQSEEGKIRLRRAEIGQEYMGGVHRAKYREALASAKKHAPPCEPIAPL